MTAQPGSPPQAPSQQQPPQQAEPERIGITPVPESILDMLLSQHHAAKAAAEETAERLKALTDRIKSELTMAHPGATGFEIAGSAHRSALTLRWVNTTRLDTDRMKREAPETYVEFATFGGRWELRPARGGL